jgi:Protein of unknown function (DUF1236)
LPRRKERRSKVRERKAVLRKDKRSAKDSKESKHLRRAIEVRTPIRRMRLRRRNERGPKANSRFSKVREQQGKQQGQKERTEGQGSGRAEGQNTEPKGKAGSQKERTEGQGGGRNDVQKGERTDTQRGERSEGRVTLSTEQKTRVRETVLQGGNAPRANNVNFQVRVGTTVPTSVRVVEVAPVLIEVHPEWRGYFYFIVNDEIIIVDRNHRIIAVLEV